MKELPDNIDETCRLILRRKERGEKKENKEDEEREEEEEEGKRKNKVGRKICKR